MFPLAAAGGLSRGASWVVGRMGTDAHLYDDPDDAAIPGLLDSRFDADKADALKRLLALIAQGADVSHLFPQVVKNVASQSLEVKKLVYLYLLHYAEKRQNEALLSINIFQKDLSDTNPLVRAWALRTIAGIRLHVVAPLVLVAVKKCARDPSAYIRKCAAYALCKLYDLLPDESTTLGEIVDVLFNDNSPGVVGAAAVAFKSVCPNNLELLRKHFRRLCETLPDVEEWTQIILIEMLLRYVIAAHGLVKDSVMFASSLSLGFQCNRDSATVDDMSFTQADVVSDGVCHTISNSTLLWHYIEEDEAFFSHSGYVAREDDKFDFSSLTTTVNDDIRILLKCTLPLLWSQNSGVVLAAASVHWILAPVEEVKRIVGPMLFTLRSSLDAAYVMLGNILVFAKAAPSLFAPFYEDFFICASDPYQTRALKLEILSTIATESSIPAIFEEFQDYIKDPDRRFVADTVAAIGLCAKRLPTITVPCLEGLLTLVLYESSLISSIHFDGEDAVLVQAIMSIKAIVKRDPASYEKVIVRLVHILDKIKEPAARSLIIWILGEYNSIGNLVPKITPTVLNYLAWSFAAEALETKLQILNTSAKVLLHSPEEHLDTFKKIMAYIIELASCDLNYDVRDRARFVSRLIPCYMTHAIQESSCPPQNGDIYRELVDHIFNGKMQPISYSSGNFRIYLPGSLSQIVLHAAPGYAPLPKPQSMVLTHKTMEPSTARGIVNSFDNNNSDTASASSTYESGSVYDSEGSDGGSSDRDGSGYDSDPNDDGPKDIQEAPLVHLDDANINQGQTSRHAEESLATLIATDLTEMMSKSALESWLDETPVAPTARDSTQASLARISFTNYSFERKPKLYMLLDPSNSNGLSVQYGFSSEVSSVSRSLVCVDMFFENVTTEPLTNVTIKSEEASGSEKNMDQSSEGSESIPIIVPVKEIPSLAPHQTVKMVLQVHFHHHLLPLKLSVFCNGSMHVAKLQPDIAYFVRSLMMDIDTFLNKEKQLRGMFEYARRCIFKDHLQMLEYNEQSAENTDKNLLVARGLASKILCNSNFHLVSIDMPVTFSIDDISGLCWRFSGEVLSSSSPCLIAVTAEGKISGPLDLTVKVNCEDTVFGLNLLNRVVAIIE